MLGSWNIDVSGQNYVVTIERGPNGKDVVRVNGRVAAKPIGAEEEERAITVGGAAYIINRTGPDTYNLVEDEWAVAQERMRTEAATVLARSKESPVSMVGSAAGRMIPIVGWGLVVGIIAALMIYATGDNYAELAGKRVKQILTEMQTANGDNMKLQFAVTLWAKNRRVLESSEMSWASDNFDGWLRAKGLYNKAFSSFEILDSKEVEGAQTPTALVTFKIEGTEYRVRVPKDMPISWEN